MPRAIRPKLADGFAHSQSLNVPEIQFHFSIFHDRRAGNLRRQLREQFLVHRHQVLIIAVGFIKLQHREFGIMLSRDAFVAEVAINLIHTIKTAHNQPLQIKLGGDPQIQINV